MKDDPCFRCILPDCDEHAPDCALRRIANRVDRKRRHGRACEVTAEERAAYNALFRIWKIDDLAKRSEARS